MGTMKISGVIPKKRTERLGPVEKKVREEIIPSPLRVADMTDSQRVSKYREAFPDDKRSGAVILKWLNQQRERKEELDIYFGR
jgi:hypothetical protein